MTAGRILIVEDNPDNMTLVTDILHSLNYDVIQAYDGEEGMQLAAEARPDLVLMDLSLPRVDGLTATQQIKADPNLKHIPVIAVTAHALVGDRERALNSGCDDYISKPINVKELAAKVAHYLG